MSTATSATSSAMASANNLGMCFKGNAMTLLKLAVLFYVLSPGVLLTLPPGNGGVIASQQTSFAAAAVHSVVFVLVVGLAMCLMKPKGGKGGKAPAA